MLIFEFRANIRFDGQHFGRRRYFVRIYDPAKFVTSFASFDAIKSIHDSR